MNTLEYQTLALRTMADQEVIRQRVYAHGVMATQLDNAARGLSSDAGEFSNAVQVWLEYGKEMDPINMKEELGDCLWRIVQACSALGISLEAVMEANIRKLAKRYPLKYEDALAHESGRDRSAERTAVTGDNCDHVWAENAIGMGHTCTKCDTKRTAREMAHIRTAERVKAAQEGCDPVAINAMREAGVLNRQAATEMQIHALNAGTGRSQDLVCVEMLTVVTPVSKYGVLCCPRCDCIVMPGSKHTPNPTSDMSCLVLEETGITMSAKLCDKAPSLSPSQLHGADPDRLEQNGTGFAEPRMECSAKKSIFCPRALELRCGFDGMSGCTEKECPCFISGEGKGTVTHILDTPEIVLSNTQQRHIEKAHDAGFDAARSIITQYLDGKDQEQALRTINAKEKTSRKEFPIG